MHGGSAGGADGAHDQLTFPGEAELAAGVRRHQAELERRSEESVRGEHPQTLVLITAAWTFVR